RIGDRSGPPIGAIEVGTAYQPLLEAIRRGEPGDLAVVLPADRVDAAMFAEHRGRHVIDLDGCACVLEATTSGRIVDVLQAARGRLMVETGDERPRIARIDLADDRGRTVAVLAAAWPLHDYAGLRVGQAEPVDWVVVWDDVSAAITEYRFGLVSAVVYAVLALIALELVLFHAVKTGTRRLQNEIDRSTRAVRELASALRTRAETDDLTGLANRSAFFERARRLVDLGRGDATPIGVAMIDIDHFKRINDDHGHDAGDRVLATVAAALRDEIRPTDVLCRFGGEEFLACLWDVGPRAAHTIVERARRAVDALAVETSASRIVRPKISVGVTTLDRGEDLDAAIRRADALLYRAKQRGRNQVAGELCGEEMEERFVASA
ncbi:MAG: diguanylate cyclase, partial [Pseudomonadota bacterium]